MTESAHEQRVVRLLETISARLGFIEAVFTDVVAVIEANTYNVTGAIEDSAQKITKAVEDSTKKIIESGEFGFYAEDPGGEG